MRILFLAYSHVAFAAGGAQQVADEMMRAALARGHDASMISGLEEQDATPFRRVGSGLVTPSSDARLKVFVPRFYDDALMSCGDWRAVAELREHIQRLRPDVIHFHHYHRLGVEALVAARLAAPSAKITLTFHEMLAICAANGQMVKTPSRELCFEAEPAACSKCAPGHAAPYFALRGERIRESFKVCDHFVFPSRALSEIYKKWGLAAERCVIIPNGLAPLAGQFPRPPPSPEVNRFAFFGQLIENKGVDVVLRALLSLAEAGRIPAAGVEFQIHGANGHFAMPGYIEYISELARRITERSGGRIRVVDRGGYQRDEIADRMAGVDWVVTPSVWPEVFGLVVSEAWMFGRPVIATDIGGLKERIRPNVDGLTFPVYDHHALSEQIAELAGNLQTWRRLSAGVLPQPTAEQMLSAYEDLWRQDPSKPTTGVGRPAP
jgi:glycosyltransferase involved in cell wall biosynthesis